MRSLYFLSTLIFLGLLCPIRSVAQTVANDKILNSNSIYSVYELSPKTTAIVINKGEDSQSASVFDKLFEKIEEQDSINQNWFSSLYDTTVPLKNVQIIDSTGVYSLLYNKKVEREMKPLVDKEFYIYGTKGFEIGTPKKVLFGLDECRTNIFAFTIGKFDSKKNGKPIFASDKKIDLVFGTNYKQIETKINKYYSEMGSDYPNNSPTKVYANIDNLYFTYTDDFKWNDDLKWSNNFDSETDKCFFPARAIFRLEKDGTITPVWQDGLDLYGIPCD